VPTSSDSDVDVIDVALEWSGVLKKAQQEGRTCVQIPRSVVAPELMVFSFKWVADKECFVVCASPEKKRSLDDILSRFKMLQMQVQLSSKNISNYMSVREMLYRDDATSLHNARYLNLSLDRAFKSQQKSGGKFGVLFVDLDHFKRVNDGHGHMIGTKLLNEVGERMKREVRQGDTVCRYGGDEFVVILNNVDIEEAKDTAERIRRSIEKDTFLKEDNVNINLTVSVGVAICPDHARTREEIVAAADHAMYAAKRNAKNMVYVAGESEPVKKTA
jgi:diguanylate cyclase (GGDEF)-like protein